MDHLDAELARQFVLGRLAPEERAAWVRHCRACAACAALVEEEQAFAGLMDLDDDDEEGEVSARLDAKEQAASDRAARRVLDSFEAQRTMPGRRRNWRWVRKAGWTLLWGLALGFGAGWFFGPLFQPTRAERTARALRISPHTQRRVIAQLDLLEVVRDDRWLIEDSELIRTLQRLIDGEGR